MTEQEALDALRAREPIFHRPEFGTSRAELERRYANPHRDEWEVSSFACRQLADDAFLVTYDLAQGERKSRRSTLWRFEVGDWKALYHQGTLVGP